MGQRGINESSANCIGTRSIDFAPRSSQVFDKREVYRTGHGTRAVNARARTLFRELGMHLRNTRGSGTAPSSLLYFYVALVVALTAYERWNANAQKFARHLTFHYAAVNWRNTESVLCSLQVRRCNLLISLSIWRCIVCR